MLTSCTLMMIQPMTTMSPTLLSSVQWFICALRVSDPGNGSRVFSASAVTVPCELTAPRTVTPPLISYWNPTLALLSPYITREFILVSIKYCNFLDQVQKS